VRTVFLGHFLRDLDKIKEKGIKVRVAEIIQQVETAESIGSIRNLKKLKGHGIAYRIKVGSYRIGLFIEDDTVEFARIIHRKDIYKKFPGN
jgi:mRNA interferase RelE/StbE